MVCTKGNTSASQHLGQHEGAYWKCRDYVNNEYMGRAP